MKTHLIIALLTALSAFGISGCKDPCKDMTCQHGGLCHEGECLCEKWYSGEECDLQYNRNYSGVYYGSFIYEGAGAARSTDSLVLTADESIPNRMHTDHGFYFDFESDSVLIIPHQIVYDDEDTLEIAGQGKYRLDWMSIDYKTVYVSLNGYTREAQFTGERVEKGQ